MGRVLCEHCTAACCRYIALPIDTPKNKRDFDDMRWYIIHENIAVFVEDGDWYIQIHNPCRNILPDGRCANYETRPAICREYTTSECDYHIGDEEASSYFDSPDALAAYAREFLRRQKTRTDGRARKTSTRRRPRRIPKGVRRSGTRPGSLGVSHLQK
jgi:Fe-S-cluster containining protein